MSDEKRPQDLKTVKQLIKSGEYSAAFELLRAAARPEDDFVLQNRYAALFRMIPEGSLGLKPVKVAFAATSTLEHFVEIFRFWCALNGFGARTYLAEFDTMHQTILNPGSELYAFKPDIVWLFSNYRDARMDIPAGASREDVSAAVSSAAGSFTLLWDALRRHSGAHIVQNNADLPLCRVFGNYEGSAPWGAQNALRLFNVELANAVSPGVTIFDIDHISASFGKDKWSGERYWYHSKHAFAPDASGVAAFSAARLLGAIKGAAKKCLVLDLDNTLWGGVIGDDGIEGIRLGTGADGEAFVDFQKYLLALKNRGIILTVCSKNEDGIARAPFMSHPETQLKLEDFAVFVANWENKAENIRGIAETLDIGLDSMVFVDDNPFERNLVRTMLPMVAVPEMPEDPVFFIRALDAGRYFETISFSQEDSLRGEMYRGNAERKGLRGSFENIDDYLRDLAMEAEAEVFDTRNLARISQLINKSNQFHLTTTRYSEAEILAMMPDPGKICMDFRLRDRFGDNGLIAIVILEEQPGGALHIDTWVMSCRVLLRGMEEFVFNEIAQLARRRGISRVTGKYIPTPKNKIVEKHYEKLGFKLISEENGTTLWECAIDENTPELKCFIRRAEQ